MRTFSARVVVLLMGVFLILLWPLAVTFALLCGMVAGEPLRLLWREALAQLREIGHDWLAALRDPMSDGAESGC